MDGDAPLAYFITWTVYGTFLQGDPRGWNRRRQGYQPPLPRLVQWRRERLKFALLLLNGDHQAAVAAEIRRMADFRGWQLWAARVQANHVHVAVAANGFVGSKVRDQLKANCTRVLRASWPQFADRPVWTTGGDWHCLNSEDELERVVLYIDEAQDRKMLDDR